MANTAKQAESKAKAEDKAEAKPLTGKAKEDYDARVAAQTEDKPKRRTLSTEERIAKLEAELAAAREKANARGAKQLERLDTQLKALREKRDELDAKISSVQAERDTVAAKVNGTDEDEASDSDEAAA